MKRLINLITLYIIGFAFASAQVTVDATLDSAGIFIGKRMGISLEVSADAKKNVELPQFDSLKQIIPGIEFVNATPVDTEYINEGQRMVLRRKYYITSFDTALYLLPSFDVKVGKDTFRSKQLAIKVIIPFEIDTLHIDSICPYKAEMSPEFSWDEWNVVIGMGIIGIIVGALLVWVIIRLKNNKPILRRIRTKKKLAPHKAAMIKIEEIKEDKTLWQGEDSKEYYTQLTDTLRRYIEERYGFSAMEMTSYEIIQKLQGLNDEEAIKELRELFQTADLVKFAKFSTMINENDRNLVTAIEYINQTKLEEVEQKPQPEVIIVEEESSKRTKQILICGIVFASAALIGAIGFIIYRIYMLTL